jgi:nicotinate phosphoribosyltransferase
LLDEAGIGQAQIVASGDFDERKIAAPVAAGAPVDAWCVGTDLGTSRDSPVVNGVYKLVAHQRGGRWKGKLSPANHAPRRQAGLPSPRGRGHGGRHHRSDE